MSATSDVAGPQPRRWLWGILLILALVWSGLVLGTAVGSRWVPEGSGLAGPAMALGYGLIAAGGGLVLGLLLAWLTPPGLLRVVSILALLGGLVLAGLVAGGLLAARAERRAEAGLDEPLPGPGGFTLEAWISEEMGVRPFREMQVDSTEWSARWVAVGPEAALCTTRLSAAEARALKDDLELLEARFRHQAPPCAGEPGPVIYGYTWSPAGEGDVTPATTRTIEASSACQSREEPLGALYRTLRRIVMDSVSHGRVDCTF